MSLKKELTVRPVANAMGIRAPAFKVYREAPDGTLQIPRFFRGDTRIFNRGEDVNIDCSMVLRDYQKEALKAFKGNGVLSLSCGMGKSLCGVAFAARLKRKTLVIVHKEFLADQWIERIQQYSPSTSVGRIQGNTWDIDGHQIVIAMIQTLCAREFDPKQFESFGFLIVDEAHHIGAPAFSQVMFLLKPEFTLGLTATPDRKDGLTCLLYWFLGPMFYSKYTTSKTLKVNRIDFRYDGPVTLNKMGKISMASMVTELTELPARNKILIDTIRECQRRGRNALVLSDRREHCKLLASETDSYLYIGGNKAGIQGEPTTIISTFSLAYEGLDIPYLDTLILATPHSDIVQSLGRIMRKDGEKEVFDVVDNWSIFPSMWYKRHKTYFPPAEEGCLL